MTAGDLNLALSHPIADPSGTFGYDPGQALEVELYPGVGAPEQLNLNIVYFVFLIVSHNQHLSKNQAKAIN